jgi:hypothetical protein
MRSSAAPLLLSCILVTAPAGAAFSQTPQPFPRAGTPPSTTSTQAPAGQTPRTTPPPPATAPAAPAPTAPVQSGTASAATANEPAPTAEKLGLPLPPGAQFIASYDAGQGQRYFLFGTGGTYAEVLNFYRTALKQRGDVVFEEPATHIFEVGRFREETMAFPPSVVVKDYMWGNIGGYVNPKPGAQPPRFATVIQIVPIPAGEREQ